MTTELESQYYSALGRFVHVFAKVEAFLHISFAPIANIPAAVANIIKKDMSSGTLVPIVKGLMKENRFSASDIADAESVFDQFKHISIFRHSVIHRGADVQEDGTFFCHNGPTAMSVESYETASFTISDIKAATADLEQMQFRILRLAHRVGPEAFGLPQPYAPWKFKPVTKNTPFKQARVRPERVGRGLGDPRATYPAKK